MAYIVQQVLVGLGLAWAVRVLWGEVWGLMREGSENHAGYKA